MDKGEYDDDEEESGRSRRQSRKRKGDDEDNEEEYDGEEDGGREGEDAEESLSRAWKCTVRVYHRTSAQLITYIHAYTALTPLLPSSTTCLLPSFYKVCTTENEQRARSCEVCGEKKPPGAAPAPQRSATATRLHATCPGPRVL